jgi:hypothetical protein
MEFLSIVKVIQDVDMATSLNNGMLKFIKGTTAKNKITLLEAKPHGVSSQLEIMVNTNKARNSKSTIEAVMRLQDSDNAKFTQAMTWASPIREFSKFIRGHNKRRRWRNFLS